jgi:hypothetical protein
LDFALKAGLQEPDFFKKTAGTSSYLAGLLLAGATDDLDKYSKMIEDDFANAWKREGTESDRKSFIEYLEFIEKVIKNLNPVNMSGKEEKIQLLESVRRGIEKL